MKVPASVLALALVACSATTPTIEETNRPTPSVSTSAARRRPAPIARQAVFASNDAIWIYDVAKDVVRQVASGTNLREPRWVSKTEVSFVQGEAGGEQRLRIVDIAKKTVSDVFGVRTGIDTYGWSPDRETVAYITTDRFSYPHLEYRSIGAGVTQSVATLAPAPGRDLSAHDQRRIGFDRTGQYVLVVDTYADGQRPGQVPDDQSQFQVRSITGELVFSVDHDRDPTMAVWGRGGTAVFYRTDSGVRSWKTGAGTSNSVTSVRWFEPSSSPDGSFIAYDTGAVTKKVKVNLLVLKGARVVPLSKEGFAHPIVAASRTVWVQRVTPCDPDCPVAVSPAPEVFAIDVKTKKARKLALTTLFDLDVRYE